MARVDDVVWQYLHRPDNEPHSDVIKEMLAEAVRYGFNRGEQFGKYEQYGKDLWNRMLARLLEKSEAVETRR